MEAEQGLANYEARSAKESGAAMLCARIPQARSRHAMQGRATTADRGRSTLFAVEEEPLPFLPTATKELRARLRAAHEINRCLQNAAAALRVSKAATSRRACAALPRHLIVAQRPGSGHGRD